MTISSGTACLIFIQEELSSWALGSPCNANQMMLVQTIGRAVLKCIRDLNKTTNANVHFFILFLNTFENTKISHAQRHNSRRRKVAQSFLFCPSSYTFHVALITKRTKVWGRAIQLNYTPLPGSEERNFKLFYFTYWVILRQRIFHNFKGFFFIFLCINETLFILFISENSAVFSR